MVSSLKLVSKYGRKSALCSVSAARRATVACRNPWCAVYDISGHRLRYRCGYKQVTAVDL